MKYFKNFIIIFLLFSNQIFSSSTFTNAELEVLSQYRTTDLIICNDTTEGTLENIYFPWDLIDSQNKNSQAITQDLASALLEDQLVLCSKSLWQNLKIYAQIWQNLATKNVTQIWEIYKDIPNIEQSKFIEGYNTFHNLISQNYLMYQQINNLISDNKSSNVDNLQKILQSFIIKKISSNSFNNEKEKLIKDSKLKMYFYNFVIYNKACNSKYVCKEVNDDYLLFIPENKLLDVTKNIIFNNLYLGLNFYNLKDYPFNDISILSPSTTYIENQQKTSFDVKNLNSKTIQLITALKMLSLSQNNFGRDIKQPFFNVILNGHGGYGLAAGISTKLRIKNNQSSSTFLDLLTTLQQKFIIKIFILSSCYVSGLNIKKIFNLNNQLYGPLLEKYPFTIIFSGITKSKSYGNINKLRKLPTIMKESDILIEDIHKKEGLFYSSNNSFTKTFYSLNNSDHIDYLESINHLSQIYEKSDKNFPMKFESTSNYISIKFPNTSWFTPAEFKEYVLQISQIAMSTKQKPIIIEKTIKLILIGANYIPISFIINREYLLPTFIPVNYYHPNYIFTKIDIRNPTPEDDLETVIAIMFLGYFDINNLDNNSEYNMNNINILIKNLKIGSKLYKNVIIFIEKPLESTMSQNEYKIGYIYTNEEHQTFIVSWDFKEKKTELFDKQKLELMITDIEKEVSNLLPDNLKQDFLQDLSTKIAKKPSQEIIANKEILLWFNENKEKIIESVEKHFSNTILDDREKKLNQVNIKIKEEIKNRLETENIQNEKNIKEIQSSSNLTEKVKNQETNTIKNRESQNAIIAELFKNFTQNQPQQPTTKNLFKEKINEIASIVMSWVENNSVM